MKLNSPSKPCINVYQPIDNSFPLERIMKVFFRLLAVLLLGWAATGYAQTTDSIPVSTTDMHTATVNVTPGNTVVEIPFTVQTSETYIFHVIAPVNGVAMSVVAPSGAVFVPSTDSRIHFVNSVTLGVSTPGGVLTTDDITPNANGVWKLHFTFPAATEKTVILASWVVNSAYHIGLLTDQSQYVVGNTGAIWVFGTEDGQSQAVLNSNPQVTVQLLPSGAVVPVSLKDDGVAPDGQASDGLFAGTYAFTAPGTYLVSASVTLPTANGSVVRTAEQQVTVINPPITLNGTSMASTGSGCAQSLGVNLNVTVNAAGTYVFHGQLAGPDGTTVPFGQTFTHLAAGTQSLLVPIDMDDVKEKLGYVSPLTVSSMVGIYVDSDSSDPVVQQDQVGTYAGAVCRDAIDVTQNLSVSETMQDGQIGALNFSFPVYVAAAGSYDVTFNVIGPNGELIDQVDLPETLTAGNNTIAFSEPGQKFANINGPYRISGLLVVGAGSSTTVIDFAPTQAFSGLQFVGASVGASASTAVTPVPVNAPWMLALLAVLIASLAGLGLRQVRRHK